MRLFLGTYLNAECRKRLCEFQNRNSQDNKALETIKVRWIHGDKLHMTWNFLGQVKESSIPSLLKAIERAVESYGKELSDGAPPPLVSFEQPSLWPRPSSPRLLVVQPQRIGDSFNLLARLLRENTDAFVEKDKGEHYDVFKPHITLARLGAWREDSSKHKLSLGDFAGWAELLPMLLNIETVDLISSSSNMGDSANAYQTVQEFSVNKFHKP
ncbi:MAG TPA: hypothetical protein V6C97_34560 [Oculatellaceae cyanobacterium]